ncbi:MAG TPA: glucose-6-phosphate dehydrogenase [Candidatus Binatia bacterium]|jgi:glucose-6-phosphate 1-dehydrogenase|nr:glucose-6-phosphate dehydrogenase [Candidatus Binatia bacterium]
MQEKAFEVGCAGLARGKPPEPCTVVIFGASGDLARRELIPALFALSCENLLPNPFAIIGFARTEWDDEQFRTEMYKAVKSRKVCRADQWPQFARCLHYVRGDYTDEWAHTALHKKIEEIQANRSCANNILFHLSVPPHLYGGIVEQLSAGPLANGNGGWRRVVIEKPFGRDGASARALDHQIRQAFTEEQIYRIDHYLGKETVQNMLVFRFANVGFAPVWNRNYIDHIQITVAESLGIGTRGEFYESTGVVRDMVQNHLLQLLCLAAIEPPVRYEASSLRAETAKVLEALAPLDLQTDCVLGQYGAGQIEGEKVKAYRDEEHIAAEAKTPTFVALKLMLDNWRWAGVPFYLRTGKRLPRKVTEITVHFKPTPRLMFPIAEEKRLLSNVLAFRLQPEEGILYTFLAKQPGADLCLRPVRMHFRYDTAFGIETLPSAYEWLLLDAMHGDQTLFPHVEWIQRAWSFIDPIVAHGEAQPAKNFPNYAAGTWGPAEAEAMIRRDGREWTVV